MKNNVIVAKVGAISPFGNDIKSIISKIQSNQNGILTDRFNRIKDFNFYGLGFKTKTYTDRSSQLCVHAVAQCIGDANLEPYDLGLMTASKYGCLESAMKYLNQLKTLKNKWFASPMQFTHSICNIPNSIACIEFGIKGITNHFFGNAQASLHALWQACVSLKETIAKEIIVCAFDSISDEHIRVIGLEQKSNEIVYSEAAASMRLKLEHESNDDERLCEITGIGFSSSEERGKSLEYAISKSIKDANITPKDVKFFVSNAYLTNDFYNFEKKYVEEAIYEGIPVLMLKRYFGESSSASIFMSIVAICNIVDMKLPFNFVNIANGNFDKKIHVSDIAVLAAYNSVGDATAISIKIGGKNG